MKIFIVPFLFLVLIISGCDFIDSSTVDSVMDSVERDNPVDNDFWEYVTELPGIDRTHGAVFAREGTIYMGFNYDVDSVHSMLWSYSISEKQWNIIGENSDPDGPLLSEVVKEDDYHRFSLFMGTDVFFIDASSASIPNLYEFDSGTELITELDVENFSTNLNEIDCSAANTSDIFIVSTTNVYPLFYLYDLNSETRIEVSDSYEYDNYQRDFFCFSMNEDFYIGGGRYGEDLQAENSFRQYDPDSHAWMDMPDLPETTGWAGKAAVIGSTAYVLYSDGNLYFWTQGDDQWTAKTSFPENYSMDYENSTLVADGGILYLVPEGTGLFGRREVFRYVP